METVKALAESYEPKTSWSEDDWTSFNKWLQDMLRMGPVIVTFTKKDGSERVMECTLSSSLIPEKTTVTETSTRKQSTTSIAAYDLQAKGWRSFILKNVKHVSFTI